MSVIFLILKRKIKLQNNQTKRKRNCLFMLNLVMIENDSVEMVNFDYVLIEYQAFELFY
jgi:hypothetical protein